MGFLSEQVIFLNLNFQKIILAAQLRSEIKNVKNRSLEIVAQVLRANGGLDQDGSNECVQKWLALHMVASVRNWNTRV